MHEEEGSCGQELADNAAVPERFGALFTHVALNLRAHAAWVGTATEGARREHDAMLDVAQGYEAIGAAALRTAERMRASATLPVNPHDPEQHDRQAFTAWMKRKLELQRELAAMLLEHAEQSERVLAQLSLE